MILYICNKEECEVKVIGYIRVKADSQDLEKQKHLLLDYARKNQLSVNEFIHAEASSSKGIKERIISELLTRLTKGDTLLVTDLSSLGRTMLETLNIINELSQNGVDIVFVRQPELSTIGTHAKLLLKIYSYFAEAEREYISIRTKQGLAAARAKGKMLGRPKGSRNKNRVLDPYKEQIKEYLQMGLNLASIMKIVNNQAERPVSYNTLKYFVQHDEELLPHWEFRKVNRTVKMQPVP
jgi:DNA invertase Pin-like site-specific DNA recombinase